MSELELDKKKNQAIDLSLIEKFNSMGFNELTEIQKLAIPKIQEKKNSLILAPTGSGKTECSVIPIFSHISKSKTPNKIKALYITPLRALNRDVFRRIINYAKDDGLKIDIRHGDTSQKDRKRISDLPPDILITTPETLVILLSQKIFLSALSELEWIVVDEVHELLASERGTQLSLSMERLELNSNQEIHRVGLSATVGNVSEAGKFLVGSNRHCEIIQDKAIRKYDVDIKFVNGSISEIAEEINDYIIKLNINSPVLLFTNSRGESEFLASVLKEKTTIQVELHHGSLSRQVREETENILRDGKLGIVVCTSSLELGLDIGSIELVIHYGSPRQVSKFMQRLGRSKHNKNSSAKGLIISNHADDEFETHAILERIKESSIEEQKIHDESLDVLAHHLVGLTIQLGNVSVETAFKTVKQSYPFRNLQLEEFSNVLEILDSQFLIFFNKKNMSFWKKGKSFRYHFENLSTIPDILKFKVIDTIDKKFIGTLDQRFVGDYGEPGNIFVLRGSQWKILNVDQKSFQVNVEPMGHTERNVPYWEGENIPVDYKTAQKVGHLRTKVKNGSITLLNKIISEFNFDKIPDEKTIVAESNKSEGLIVLHTCFGTKINLTLSSLLSTLLSDPARVEVRSDAYRIVLSSTSRISKTRLMQVLNDNYDMTSIVSASLIDTHNVNWKTWCVAKKFGVVQRGSIYTKKQARFLYQRYSNLPLGKEALRELFHDKFDLLGTQIVLDKIKNKEVIFEWFETTKFSKLAEPILDHTEKYYSSPANIDKSKLDLVKKRLFKTKHRLICARCGLWQRIVIPNEIPKPLRCKYCKGKQITATFISDSDLQKIIQKNHNGKKLTPDEKHKFKRAWKVSSLIESFGETALIVLSGYGVGADTAGRILRNMIDNETLYKQIYTAERQYVMTRGFWDD